MQCLQTDAMFTGEQPMKMSRFDTLPWKSAKHPSPFSFTILKMCYLIRTLQVKQ